MVRKLGLFGWWRVCEGAVWDILGSLPRDFVKELHVLWIGSFQGGLSEADDQP